MSATIDERVVEMKFNNKDFEQNAKESISTIERLKQALNFTSSSQGLDEVQNAVKRVDMNGLGNAVDSVKLKFSALQVAAITALTNIVNKAVNAGQQIAKSFTLDPIIQGFNEYELKMGSIQTILANTQNQTGTVSQKAVQEVNTAAEQAVVKSEELNQQAIENLQKRGEAEVEALEKSNKAQLKALEKSQKQQSKALSKSQKAATKKLQESHDKEVEALQETQEKRAEILAESQAKELENLNKNYDKQIEALNETTSRELETLRKAHQDKLDMYNEEYMTKLKAADESRYNQIKAIEDEIESLRNLTKAEKKANEDSAKQEKLNSLKALREKVETEDERKYVEKQISDYEAELEQERVQEERENRIEELQNRKDDINEEFNITKENLQKEYQANVQTENDIYDTELKTIQETQDLKLQAIQETYKKELESLNKRQKEESKALSKKQQEESKALSKRQQDESEKLSERQQDESEALSERQQEAREALSERQQSEQKALSERQSAEMQAISERHQTELANIEEEKGARLKALNEEAAKNVKPTTLEDVTDALDELNTYADKTIYNFADMTKNIGTFTAAGVDLDTSVSAIKGIANLAAMSGAGASKASNAMYQLSQAIASGTVRLQDWMSVEHSDMGGKLFQESLKETARAHGIAVDEMIQKNGSFRNSLSEGWLTSDVLLETLSKFTGDLTEEQLQSMGYTEEQTKDIIKMGKTAVDAATKVRTSTQLLDTVKESIGSGWAQSFELIFGDFNEATDLWTGLSNAINGGLQKQIDYRNQILTIWKANGGRTALIEAFKNAWEGLSSVIKPVQEAFRDIFPKTTGQQLITWTRSLRDFTSRLKLSDTASENLKNTFSGLFSLISLIGKGFKAAFQILKPGVGVITNLAGGALDLTGKLGAWITQINNTVSKDTALVKGFESIKSIVESVFEVFNNFVTSIRNFVSSIFKMPFLNLIKTGFTETSKVLAKVAPVFKALIKPITDLFKGGMGLEDAVNILAKGTLTVAISKFILDLSGLIKKAKKAFNPLKDIAKEIGDTFGALQNQINSKALMNVAAAIAILVGSLLLLSKVPEDKLGSSLASIAALLGELVGVIVVLSKSDAKAVKGISTTMLAMSASVLILAVAMKKIADADPEQMIAAGVAVGALLGELAFITSKMAKSEGKFKAGALSLIAMGVSVLLLAEAVKKLSKLKPGELLQGGGAVAAALLLIAAMSKASEKGGFKISNGAGILALAASMLVFQKAVSAFGQMDVNQLKQGGIAVGLLIGALTAFEAIAGRAAHGFGSSAGTLMLAASLTLLLVPLKVLGAMDFNQLKQGLGATAVALGEFAVAALLMKGTQSSAVAITAMAAALLILTPVLKVLGTMNLPALGIALGALAGTFGVLGVAALLLKPVAPTLLKLSAAVAILGVGMLGIGAGVAAFAVGLTTLAGAGAAAAAALVLMVKSVIVGALEAINESLPLIIDTLKNLVLNSLQALSEIIPQAASTLYTIITTLLTALTQYVPDIIAQLMTFLTNVINALSENIPELVKAVVNLFATFFASIIEALKGMDTQTLEDALLGVGVFSAILVAFAGFSKLAIPAMEGIAGLAGVIAEITALIAVAGAIGQIPGFNWLIGEGGEVLKGVGTAIGKFAGGIIGGFAEGISSSFPQIATDLSNFMTNLKPFIEGTKNIDSESMNAVGSIVDMILKLTAADLINGIKRFFSFGQSGTSFSGFADELITFGPKIKQFANSVKGIDETAVTAAASAASIMSEVAKNLPKSGGFWQKLVGETSTLSSFGKELAAFGPSIKTYSDTVAGGIDESAVNTSANAAKIMSEVAKNLPKTGGYWQKFFGGNISLSTFGSELESFGPSIKSFADSVSGGIDETAVSAATNAALALAGLANNLPKSGGFLQDFFGEQNLETFGDQLESFGSSMKAYSDAITEGDGFNADAATASANAGKALASFANNLPKQKGAFSFFTGESDISSFGSQLKKFGEAFKGYYDSISGINTSTMSSVVKSIKDMVGIASDTKDLDTSGLKNFGKNLKKMGDNGISGFIEAFEKSNEKITEAINTAIGYIKTALSDSQDDVKDSAKTAGKKLGSGLKSGIEAKGEAITTAADQIVTAVTSTFTTKLTKETLKTTGSNAISGLGKGIKSEKDNINTDASTLVSSILKNLTGPLDYKDMKTVGSNAITGISNGMVEHENGRRPAYKTASDLGEAIRKNITGWLKYDDFVTVGSNVAVGLINGMNGKLKDVRDAATNLGKTAGTATSTTLQVKSPSRLFMRIGRYLGDGLCIGILDRIDAVNTAGEDLGNSAITPMQAALNSLNGLIEDDPDFNPVITPTLDLSRVQNDAGQISNIFNGKGFGLGTSIGFAQMASTGFRTSSYNGFNGENEDKIESKLDDLIKKSDEDKENITYNNTFNIRSTDPRATANEVDRLLQQRVERRKAVWAN